MKRTGKLLVSAIWLILTFVAIVGVTFAWLSENRSVQAEGMSVQAETVKNLLISNTENGTYNFNASSTMAEALSCVNATWSVSQNGHFKLHPPSRRNTIGVPVQNPSPWREKKMSTTRYISLFRRRPCSFPIPRPRPCRRWACCRRSSGRCSRRWGSSGGRRSGTCGPGRPRSSS